MKTKMWMIAGMAAALSTSAALAAPVDFSVVNGPAQGEVDHHTILGTIYGGTFNTLNSFNGGTNFRSTLGVVNGSVRNNAGTVASVIGNGTVTVTRVQDRNGVSNAINQLLFGGGNDQRWSDGIVTAVAEAKYAGDTHTFGWQNTFGPGGVKTPILTTNNLNAPQVVSLSSAFRWTLDTGIGNNLTSIEAENGFDQLVVYDVTMPGFNGRKWLLFWEDRKDGQSFADYDYNDAVIEITVVPLPAPVLAAGAGLLGLALVRRRLARA